MESELAHIRKTAKEAIGKAANFDELEEKRIQYLGRERGALTLILKSLKNLPEEKRRAVGEAANRLRSEIEAYLQKRTEQLKKTARESVLKKEWLDVSRPGVKPPQGHLHPLTRITREMVAIFSSMGFSVAEGPEVETEFYNFDALNIPKNHPARDMWDTFWLQSNQNEHTAQPSASRAQVEGDAKRKSERLLLRTHTSPVQVRYMQTHNPPLRIIAPGRAYRYEATDASHDFQFHQLEGLMVDKNISIANFKAVMQEFFSKIFRVGIRIRLRPSYFPFVEPGFEVDISCMVCKTKGCSVCKKTGWLELAGAGMVHPKVFKAAGHNPKDMQGFAFGFGIERLAMMKYKINDIRLFRSGDLRFLQQF